MGLLFGRLKGVSCIRGPVGASNVRLCCPVASPKMDEDEKMEACPAHGGYDGPFCFPCIEAEYGVKIFVPHIFNGGYIIKAAAVYFGHIAGCPGCRAGTPVQEVEYEFWMSAN